MIKANERIAERVTEGFTRINQAVVEGYTKIEDRFVEQYLTRDGESVADAKARLKRNKLGVKKGA